MNISKYGGNTIEAMLTKRERRGIHGCVRESWEKLSDSEMSAQLGIDQEYLYSVTKYLGEVISHGSTEYRSQSPTLIFVEIGDDEYRLTMSPGDARLIVRCMETALRRVPEWEFHLLMGVYPKEIKELLKQFQKIL
jgi:hypothetical protein